MSTSTDIVDKPVADVSIVDEVPLEKPSVVETEAGDTTDEQIEKLLKEVEIIKQNSPVKLPTPQTTQSSESTPDSTVLSQHADSSSDSLDQVPPISTTTATQAAPSSVTTKTPVTTTNSQGKTIPKSVSQALFSNALKVTRVRDKTSAPRYIGKHVPDEAAAAKIESLQQRDYELTRKIRKLQREIDYLKGLIDTASVSSNLAELRKLRYAIERLEDFLDQKQKEKYEVGILLTRAVRKRVDSGELGEFWSK